jgi:hypothetical protein
MATVLGGFEPLNLDLWGDAHVLAAREHELELVGAGFEPIDVPTPGLRAMLVEALDGPLGSRGVASLFMRPLPGSVGDRHGFARELLELLELGRVVLLRDGRARQVSLTDMQPLEQAEPVEAVERLTWIEVLIEDEHGVGVANVRCAITLPDGSKREGRTNAHGILRHDGIPAGNCTISLLDHDAQLWAPK